jgi:hypothetical protein
VAPAGHGRPFWQQSAPAGTRSCRLAFCLSDLPLHDGGNVLRQLHVPDARRAVPSAEPPELQESASQRLRRRVCDELMELPHWPVDTVRKLFIAGIEQIIGALGCSHGLILAVPVDQELGGAEDAGVGNPRAVRWPAPAPRSLYKRNRRIYTQVVVGS